MRSVVIGAIAAAGLVLRAQNLVYPHQRMLLPSAKQSP